MYGACSAYLHVNSTARPSSLYPSSRGHSSRAAARGPVPSHLHVPSTTRDAGAPAARGAVAVSWRASRPLCLVFWAPLGSLLLLCRRAEQPRCPPSCYAAGASYSSQMASVQFLLGPALARDHVGAAAVVGQLAAVLGSDGGVVRVRREAGDLVVVLGDAVGRLGPEALGRLHAHGGDGVLVVADRGNVVDPPSEIVEALVHGLDVLGGLDVGMVVLVAGADG